MPPRIGFFTRLLERATPAERYRFALEQICHAERFGFASAWVAQHHFDADEGGLPSPFVLLAAAAERTSEIALSTGVVTLPIDDPLRAAEDASVLDALSGGRVQLGVAAGGTPSSFAPFGREPERRRELFADHFTVLLDALTGREVRGTRSQIYPPATDLAQRIWQATFSVDGGRRAGERGDGLMLSRTQPRPADAPDLPLEALQLPIIDAYRTALPAGAPARVLASRTALVVDPRNRDLAHELAEDGLRRLAGTFLGAEAAGLDIEALIRVTDTHVGTVDEVADSLAADNTLQQASDIAFQVHSIDASHELTLRSLELLATEVAPRLGWSTGAAASRGLHRAHRPDDNTDESKDA
ncbi:putative FMN-dependent luciferase-like monooxygenase [Saccharopolyspora indica]|uniref:putative FMN-dependent luciferase-like monooxygenase n=1 Tax=Saccharopolyspora indica TaxID=1229659 RepID=UPI0022EB6E6A|nr:putative FMN-dependent luciferase-like monooxygenase [Saccharopolyspora indica]MDA3644148.1 putative FMN-dependent luciferase-like monooxygenase [Saccharopolyspora indica]